MKLIKAPWTQKQIEILKKWQKETKVHPYTCLCGNILTPTINGWICSKCPEFHQDWFDDIIIFLSKMKEQEKDESNR